MKSCSDEQNFCQVCKNWPYRRIVWCIFAKKYLKFNRCMPMNARILLSVMPYKRSGATA